MQFLAKYGKTYASKHDVNTKFATFSQNHKLMKEHNEKYGNMWTQAVN